MFSIPAKSVNLRIPPFRAVEPCGELSFATPAAASIAAPLPNMAIESSNRLRTWRAPCPCQRTPAYVLTFAVTGWLADRARVDRVSDAVAQEVEGERRREDREPRPDHQPGLGRVVGRPGREQVAPARSRRIDAQPEEGEARLEQDVGGDRERRVDDDRSDQMRDDVRAHDPPVARTDHARRLDELLLA